MFLNRSQEQIKSDLRKLTTQNGLKHLTDRLQGANISGSATAEDLPFVAEPQIPSDPDQGKQDIVLSGSEGSTLLSPINVSRLRPRFRRPDS